MRKNKKIIYGLLLVFMMIIASFTSRGAYSYFTFGEKIYGQNSTEGTDENITEFPVYYIDDLITGDIKINLTDFIYDDETIKIQLLNKDETPILDDSNNQVILDVVKGANNGEYTCEFNNDVYKAIKYKIIGYSYEKPEYLTGNVINKQNIMFKRALTINYYDSTTDDLSVSSTLNYKEVSEVNDTDFSKGHYDSAGRWRTAELKYNSFCANGDEVSYDITIGSNNFVVKTVDRSEEVWIKNNKVYYSEPPEEHNISFIIDSSFNKYVTSTIGKFYLTFDGIEQSSGDAYNDNGRYRFDTKYEESNAKEFHGSFTLKNGKGIVNFKNIYIPTWKDVESGDYSKSYEYSNEHFNNIKDGGSQGSPSLKITEDKATGDVYVYIYIVEEIY